MNKEHLAGKDYGHIALGVTVLSEPNPKLTEELHFANTPPASLTSFWLSFKYIFLHQLLHCHFYPILPICSSNRQSKPV